MFAVLLLIAALYCAWRSFKRIPESR